MTNEDARTARAEGRMGEEPGWKPFDINEGRTTFPLEIPYGLTASELKPEPDTNDAQYHEELNWIASNMDEAEAERVLRAAVELFNATHPLTDDDASPTLGDCLYTAIVWERG